MLSIGRLYRLYIPLSAQKAFYDEILNNTQKNVSLVDTTQSAIEIPPKKVPLNESAFTYFFVILLYNSSVTLD